MAIDLTLLVPLIISLIALLSLYLVFGLYFLRVYYSLKPSSQDYKKDYLHLFQSLILLFFFAGRIFLATYDIMNQINKGVMSVESILIWKVGIILQMLGYGVFFYMMEKRVVKGKDKYLPFITYCAVIFIAILAPTIELTTSFILIATALSLFIPLAYLYVAIVSDGKVRRKALSICIGIILMYIATAIVSDPFINVFRPTFHDLQIYSISYCIKIIVAILFYLGFRRKME